MERNKSNINLNFTPEQQEKFNLIYAETKKLYPHLVGDDVSKQRTKVLIAHSVINDDAPLNKEDEENQVVLDLDKISNDIIEENNGQEE